MFLSRAYWTAYVLFHLPQQSKIPFLPKEDIEEIQNKRVKEIVRSNFNRRCFVCRKTEEQNGEKLSVHHIDEDKKNSTFHNLVALCRECHTKVTYGKILIKAYFIGESAGILGKRTLEIIRNPKNYQELAYE